MKIYSAFLLRLAIFYNLIMVYFHHVFFISLHHEPRRLSKKYAQIITIQQCEHGGFMFFLSNFIQFTLPLLTISLRLKRVKPFLGVDIPWYS